MSKCLFIIDGNKVRALPFEDILHIEGCGVYSIINLNGKDSIKVTKLLKQLLKELPAKDFIRLHKSHLVKISAIVEFDRGRGGYLTLINGAKIPVSYRKKASVVSVLKKNSRAK